MTAAAAAGPSAPPFPVPTLRATILGIGLALGGLAVAGIIALIVDRTTDALERDLWFALFFTLSAIAFQTWLGATAVIAQTGMSLHARLDRLGLRRPAQDDLWLAFASLAACFVLFIVYSGIVAGLDIEVLKPDAGPNRRVLDEPAGAALLGFALIVVAPPTEELFYRGLLVGGFLGWIGAWPAIVVASLLFSGSHADFGATIPLVAVGLILGYVYVKGKSVYLTLIPHVLFNALSFTVALAAG